MANYKITLTFSTDRELTQNEIENLECALLLQVEEPQDLAGEEETWSGSNLTIQTK